MRSKIVVMKSTSSGVGLIGLDSLLDVYANTVAGDLVTVYPGTYDIGNNSIQLKDGVNWNFIGRPTISSDSADGTFIDNGTAVAVNFSGDLLIINTSSVNVRISLSNALSSLSGFVDILAGVITDNGDYSYSVVLTKNTFGVNPSAEGGGIPSYIVLYGINLDPNKTIILCTNADTAGTMKNGTLASHAINVAIFEGTGIRTVFEVKTYYTSGYTYPDPVMP